MAQDQLRSTRKMYETDLLRWNVQNLQRNNKGMDGPHTQAGSGGCTLGNGRETLAEDPLLRTQHPMLKSKSIEVKAVLL